MEKSIEYLLKYFLSKNIVTQDEISKEVRKIVASIPTATRSSYPKDNYLAASEFIRSLEESERAEVHWIAIETAFTDSSGSTYTSDLKIQINDDLTISGTEISSHNSWHLRGKVSKEGLSVIGVYEDTLNGDVKGTFDLKSVSNGFYGKYIGVLDDGSIGEGRYGWIFSSSDSLQDFFQVLTRTSNTENNLNKLSEASMAYDKLMRRRVSWETFSDEELAKKLSLEKEIDRLEAKGVYLTCDKCNKTEAGVGYIRGTLYCDECADKVGLM